MDDPHQRHVRKMQPFGDHLSADQNIDLANAKIAQDAPIVVLALERV